MVKTLTSREYVRLRVSRNTLELFLHAFDYASAQAREDMKYHGFFFGRKVQELVRQMNDVVYRAREVKK